MGNKKQRLYNKAKKSKSTEDDKAFKHCRAEHKRILKKARQDYYLEFFEPQIDKSSKFLFNHIKKLKKDSVGIEALNVNGKILTEPKDKAEALASEYESVFVKENLNELPNILPSIYPDMDEFEIKEEGVFKQLNEQKQLEANQLGDSEFSRCNFDYN